MICCEREEWQEARIVDNGEAKWRAECAVFFSDGTTARNAVRLLLTDDSAETLRAMKEAARIMLTEWAGNAVAEKLVSEA